MPSEWPTIQAAIVAAEEGDAVRVAPGLYDEDIDFLGKAIVVESEEGAEATVIDGGRRGVVVTFGNGEPHEARLTGFTIQNGTRGIGIGNSSPTISENIVRWNENTISGGGFGISEGAPRILRNQIVENAATFGAGMVISGGAAEVRGNRIARNTHTSQLSGGMGGGLRVSFGYDVVIADNVIEENLHYSGGGIALWSGSPTLNANVIRRNHALGAGGAMYLANRSDAWIVNNLFLENEAGIVGGAIEWTSGPGEGPRFVNNTMVGNVAPEGGTLLTFGGNLAAVFANNLIVGSGPVSPVYCDRIGTSFWMFVANDVFSTSGAPPYGGECHDLTGERGNVSVDPGFVDVEGEDFRLREGSPVVDLGDNGHPDLPSSDFDGSERVQDGNSDGLAVVDIGAFELRGLLRVRIDIRPRSPWNTIFLWSRGLVPVALLGSPDFDVADLDPATLSFGPGGAGPVHRAEGHARDVDRDGTTDWLAHFRIPDAGIDVSDRRACLRGSTLDGRPFEGCDHIRVVGVRKHGGASGFRPGLRDRPPGH